MVYREQNKVQGTPQGVPRFFLEYSKGWMPGHRQD